MTNDIIPFHSWFEDSEIKVAASLKDKASMPVNYLSALREVSIRLLNLLNRCLTCPLVCLQEISKQICFSDENNQDKSLTSQELARIRDFAQNP